MEAGLEGVTGGSLLEGTEELPVRVLFGAGCAADPVAIADMPILPPGAAATRRRAGQLPGTPLSALGTLRWSRRERNHPAQRRAGQHGAGFLMPGCPAGRGACETPC